jgi:sec-independent protein translocase protein TatC
LIFLSLVGILSSRKMRGWRRPALLFIAIFAAVITPSSDPYSMLAMMIPMYLFYEAAIIVTRLMGK